MKHFDTNYSRFLDWLTIHMEASRGWKRLYWRLMLAVAEREALG